jgi:hypothetical protein
MPAGAAIARGGDVSGEMCGLATLPSCDRRGAGVRAGLYRAATEVRRECRSDAGIPVWMGPGPESGRLSPGLSGVADLCGPRLEGLGPDGEPQVSGESPLAVTSVPPLPCSIACPPGPGCVHRRLLSREYTTCWRVCFARPGISRLFCTGSTNNPGPASFDSALAARPSGPPASMLYRIYSPFAVKPDRTAREIRARAYPRGVPHPAPRPGGDWQ